MFQQRVLYERNISDHSELEDGPQNNQFYGLKRMKLVDCNVQPYAIPSHILSYLKSLKELEVRRCHSVRVIFYHSRIVRRRSFNLQKLTLEELSMLTHVWENNHHGILCFQNLQHVSVTRCGNLQSLFPAALAKNLKELESLQVERCDKLVEIVEKVEDAAADATEKFLFPRLTLLSPSGSKEVLYERTISDHRELQDGPQNNQFYGLKRMKLVNCNVQPYAIPSHILSYLNSLEELEVRGCYNVKVIFDSWIVRRGSFKLQNLTLEELSKLTHVWENNHHVILSFQNLQHVSVKKCHNLQSLFPAALAKNLKKLESLQIERCVELLKIVEKVEDAAADATEKFLFPRLTLLSLSGSQNLTCFYPETFILECPILEILSVFECDKLEVFQSNGEGSCSTSINKQPLFLDLKVIPNLEKLSLDLWTDPSGRLWSKVMSRQFTAPKLQEMSIHNYRSPRIFHIQDANIAELGMLGHLKILKLIKTFNLQFIVSDDTPWLNTICEKLHELEVSNCHLLTTLIHSTSVISFSSLKKLIIINCNKVEYLFTSSVAKKLMHLEIIRATSCDSMKEIVAKEQQDETTSEGIKFERLSCIELDNLSSLECFYSGNDILQFPSLKQMIIRRCLKMEFISQGSILAKSFEGIQDSYNPNDLVFHNDLNSSVKRVFVQHGFLQAMDKRCLSCHLGLQKVRDHKVGLQNKWLCDLVILKLDKCFLPYAIPSCILPYLKNLEELEVRNSDEVKVIFELNDTDPMETAVKLEKLHLEGLSELTHIWEKNSQGVAMFQNLQHVIVKSCDNLETLFPAALAKNLKKLKELKIESCDKLLDIVEKEEDAAVNVTDNFVFPCLKILDLNDLPQVTYFYPQTITLECPALNKLKVLGCPKLELFQSAHPQGEGEGSGTSITRQPHISYLKVISNVEELSLDWKHISALSLRSVQFTEGLKYLNDISLYFNADENEEPFLPTEVLQKAPNVKELRIGCCNSLNIILAQNLKIGEDGMLGLLRVFTLDRVYKLQSIKSVDSSWLSAICEKLHKLNVFECPDLTTLIPSTSTVCFSCLRQLHVTNCPELQYLFTSSAAKKLMKIELITVEECESMKEIVAKEDENETTSEEIRFEQLRNIYLISLSSLECFYSGNDTLELPSLKQMIIWKCPKMKFFSQGLILAKSFKGIQDSHNSNDDLVFHNDMNSSVKRVSLEQKLEERRESFSNHPELQEAWQCVVGPQNNWFYGLKTLKLVDCDVQTYAIPSNVLPYLNSLQELVVEGCNNVKVIFDMKDTEIAGRESFKLQKLTLQRLPGLTHVWERCGKETLCFQNLQHVSVYSCYDLQSLFPAALAKNLMKLESLTIQDCNRLLQIVEKVEDAAANVTEKFVFPRLTLLELSGLPQLTCFYSEALFILECPALKNLSVLMCDKLEIFQSNGGGSISTSINNQPRFLDLKVIPNLEELTLDWKTILRSRQFTENLKYFHKINLSFQRWDKICLIQDANVGEHRMPGHLKILNLPEADNLEFIVSEDTPWLNSICEKLHKLKVSGCDRLTTLIHPPSGISFSYLKKLIIKYCDKLEYLFTSSAAKKLMHLEMISAKCCDSIKEIVAKEQQNETTSEGIKFEQLYYIKLDTLWSLECFYSGNDTLELPSLNQMIICSCPKMEFFSQGPILAKYFKGIQETDNSNDDLVFHNDMNSSVKRVSLEQGFLQAMDFDRLSGDHRELQNARYGIVGLQNKWLCDLVTLKLDDCILPYAIPSSFFPYLKNLKELEVRNSNEVKVIFDMKDTDPMETAVKLEKLHLEDLSELTHVWEKNSQGIVMFQNLQRVIVKSCDNLETLFPVALAKNLKKLKELKIESCDKLLVIVEKEEDAAANVTENFAFPCLKMLDLNDLPRFTYFYPQIFTLECPALNNLKVLGCPKLELFQSAHPEGEGEGCVTSITRQPPISYLKVISSLEELSLDWKHISALSSSIRSGQFTEGFKYLNDISLYFDDADENEEPFLLTEVLQKAANLQELRIGRCNSLNIILAQDLKIGEDGMLGLLRVFTLDRVSKLQSINSVDLSWLNAICEKLHKLNVFSCPDLTTLIPSTSTVSFSCLRELHVTKCPELQYLFTSSAAKMLMNIEAITVEECESMKKIVAKDDETTSEGIRFEQLRNIYLISLSSLECFYSGDDILQLSSLIRVKILQCPKMEIFSQGLIHAAESFRGIQASSNTNDQLVFHEDLNTKVKKIFLQQDSLVVWDSPMLKEIWLGSEAVPDWCFRNLNSMVVESCEFLSNAILPSHLLPLLRNLRELQVKKCNSVKSIFGLSKMGSQESLPSLKELHVENCEELVEIVAKEEEATEEANQGLIIFPSLTSLKLSNLPNLRSIYSGMCVLEWPVLKKFKVSQCQMLNFFNTEFQNSPDSHLQGQDSFPTEQQAIVSLKKVTPRLEKLSLGKKEAMMIEQGKLHVDLPVLNQLRLQGFREESDEFPFALCSNATFSSCFKELVVSDSGFKQIFPSQTFNIEYAKIFSQLKELHIVKLSQLESIGLEHSGVHPFLQNIEVLFVGECHCLTNLTPSTVSFSNLIQLTVDKCHGLKYLFTSSTAKTLGILLMMQVTNCDSIKAIVAKKGYEDEGEGESVGEGEEEDEVEVEGEGEEDEGKGEDHEGENEDEIIFGELWNLTLESLPKLKSFYSGSSTLNFPSLEEVSLTRCNNMQAFSYGDVVVREDLEITIDAVSCEGDINSTIKQNIAMKRQPETSLSGERSLLVSTHGSLDSSNNAKME